MASGSFGIKGMDAVFRRLRDLPPEFHKKVLMGGMRDGAQVIADAITANAKRLDDPNTPEVIAKNVAIRFSPRRYQRTGDVMYRIGILGGARQYGDTRENRRKQRVGETYKIDGDAGNPGGETWYWRLLEFGTAKMPAKPFVRPAVEEKSQQAFQAAAESMARRMDKLKL